MTPEQIEICVMLGGANYLPASFDKRFAHNLFRLATAAPHKELTEKQNEWMYRLLYKYRRQMPRTYEKYKNHPMCAIKTNLVK